MTEPDGTPIDRTALPYNRVVTAEEALHDDDGEVSGAVIVFGPV